MAATTGTTLTRGGGTVLTWGSRRQGREFAEVAARHGLSCLHVCEEDSSGVARPVDDLVADGAKAAANASDPVIGQVSFGRATVPGGIAAIAQACEQLREEPQLSGAMLLGPSVRAAQVLSDKWQTAQVLGACGLATPDSRLVTAADVDALPLPCVLKARDLTGGAGIALVRTRAQAHEHFRALRDVGITDALCTGFVSGLELSVELLRLGDQWTVFPLGSKGFTTAQMRHADDKVKIYGHLDVTSPYAEQAIRLGEELGLQGLLSVEGIVPLDGPTEWLVLEAAPRITGNLPMELAAAGDFPLYEAMVRHLLHQPAVGVPDGPRLAVEVPLYRHDGDTTVTRLRALPGVGRAVLDDLGALPASGRTGSRIRVGFSAAEPTELLATAKAVQRICPAEPVVASVADAAREVLRVFPSPLLCELLGMLT